MLSWAINLVTGIARRCHNETNAVLPQTQSVHGMPGKGIKLTGRTIVKRSGEHALLGMR
jgi:hypothetical protein